MKRYISLLLVIAVVFSFAGCSFSAEDADKLADSAVDYLGDKLDEVVDEVSSQLPDGEEIKSNIIGSIFHCDHEPYSYKKDKNTVVCFCGANTFSSLDYDTFTSCIGLWDNVVHLFDKDKYYAETYLTYRGVNSVFFTLADKLELGPDPQQTLHKLEEFSSLLEKINVGKTVLVNFVGTADAMDQVAKFDNVFGTSLTVVQSLIHFHQMIDSNGDPYAACDEFIETVKGPIGMISGVTGGANTFLLVGLDSLKIVLDAYRVGSEAYLKNLEYTAELSKDPADGALITRWIDISETEAYWKLALTYEHIMGTEKVADLKLPSLPEIIAEYPNLSNSGKAYASEYIVFCLDFAFEEILGISYQDYITYLSE